MFCKYCGNRLDNDTLFCSACGADLNNTVVNSDLFPSSAQNSQPTAHNHGELLESPSHLSSKKWKSYMIIVLALWAISVFPLFSDWISFDLFGYYEDTISIFKINEFWQEQYNFMDEYSSYESDDYYDPYVNPSYGDYDLESNTSTDELVRNINTYITVSCISFALLFLASLSSFSQESHLTFIFSTTLSATLILFPLIVIVFMKESLKNDLLAAGMLSFTSAPYILITLNIAAIAITRIAKISYDSVNANLNAVNASDTFAAHSDESELVINESIGITTKNNGQYKIITEISDCSSFQSIIVPDMIDNQLVCEIGENVFSGCKKLCSVRLPNTITHIRYGAFYGCTNLRDIILPQNLKEIHALAFSECSSLKEIVIPPETSVIDSTAFWGCNITIIAPHEASYYGFYGFEFGGYGQIDSVKWRVEA